MQYKGGRGVQYRGESAGMKSVLSTNEISEAWPGTRVWREEVYCDNLLWSYGAGSTLVWSHRGGEALQSSLTVISGVGSI